MASGVAATLETVVGTLETLAADMTADDEARRRSSDEVTEPLCNALQQPSSTDVAAQPAAQAPLLDAEVRTQASVAAYRAAPAGHVLVNLIVHLHRQWGIRTCMAVLLLGAARVTPDSAGGAVQCHMHVQSCLDKPATFARTELDRIIQGTGLSSAV